MEFQDAKASLLTSEMLTTTDVDNKITENMSVGNRDFEIGIILFLNVVMLIFLSNGID